MSQNATDNSTERGSGIHFVLSAPNLSPDCTLCKDIVIRGCMHGHQHGSKFFMSDIKVKTKVSKGKQRFREAQMFVSCL